MSGSFHRKQFAPKERLSERALPVNERPIQRLIRPARLRATILSSTLLLISLPAFAGLGEDVSSVQADQAHMQGALRTTQTQSYTVHEIQAAQAKVNAHAGRRPLVIEQPGLVVRSGGHMRWFAGQAYIPEMLPRGVTAEAIR